MALLTGGCLCGAVRYRASGAFDAGYCHCRMCQRISGAPAQTYVLVPIAGFAYVKGAPGVYLSSDHGERHFCSRCGSSLGYRERNDPQDVSLNATTLDDPSLASPRKHIWTKSRIGWFKTADELPVFHQGETDGED